MISVCPIRMGGIQPNFPSAQFATISPGTPSNARSSRAKPPPDPSWSADPTPPAGSKATSALQAARGAAAETLTEAGYAHTTRRNGDAYGLCALFAALLKLEDEAVLSLLALAMAETLEAGTATVEAVLHVCGADLSRTWAPEPAFFDLLRDKSVINALLADIATDTLAARMVTDTGKMQKAAIGNRITGEGCAANPDWRPGWMQVPPVPLIADRPSAPAEAWARVSALFEPSESDGE